MAKHYTVVLNDGTKITRARKDAALKAAEASDQGWQLLAPSGTVLVNKFDRGATKSAENVSERPSPLDGRPAPDFAPEPPVSEPEPEPTPVPEPEASSAPETGAEEADEEEIEVPTTGKPVDMDKMRKRIALLLAKASRTDNEHERDTFTAAAERMMIRLGINAAELEVAGEIKSTEEIIEVKREWHGNYSIAWIPFTYDLARGFGNLEVFHSDWGAPMNRTSFIVGHKSDVEAFLVLLESMFQQASRALKTWQRENRAERRHLTDMQKYVQHRSFITAFGVRVSRRLTEMRATEEKNVSPGAAIVLASKMDRVRARTQEMHPNIKEAKGGMKMGSAIGREAGRAAGEKASIGKNQVEARKELS